MAWTFRGTCQEEHLTWGCLIIFASSPKQAFSSCQCCCSQRPQEQKPSCLVALLNISIPPRDLMFDPVGTDTSACDREGDTSMWSWGRSLFLPKPCAPC